MSHLKILGGEFKGRSLQSPSGTKTRPTQAILRQAVFNICQNEIDGARFLDLFAGSGAMGLEAISRGAKNALLVEQDRNAIQCIRANIKLLQVEGRVELLARDYAAALQSLVKRGLSFDIIYIDPPYAEGRDATEELLSILENNSLLMPNGRLFLEESSRKEESVYSCKHLRKKDSRQFGAARLEQFVYLE